MVSVSFGTPQQRNTLRKAIEDVSDSSYADCIDVFIFHDLDNWTGWGLNICQLISGLNHLWKRL